MRGAFFLAAAALMAASAVNAASPEEETRHVVQPGETLNGIANRAKVSSEAIAKANGLKAPYVLHAGQALDIPRKGAPTKAVAAQTKVKAKAKAKTPAGTPAASVSGNAPGTPANKETVHVVQPGETLGGIAQRAEVPRVLIAEANGLTAPFNVRIGQKLIIPRTRHHLVKDGDTGFSIAMSYGVPWEQIAVANGVAPDAPVKIGQNLLIPTLLNPPAVAASPAPVPTSSPAPAPAPVVKAEPKKAARFAWPLQGPVRRSFQEGSDHHDGLDITAPRGAMVRAAAAGTVVFAGKEKEQFGNLVVVDHGDGWFTAYGFLSRVTVKKGAKVAAGERVGLVGDTGLAKGNELHFEVRKDGSPIDPMPELPPAS